VVSLVDFHNPGRAFVWSTGDSPKLETQTKSRQQEVDATAKDQARLHENMKALKGSPEEKALLQRYTHQLDSQEDRLNTLNKEIADLQEKQTQEQEAPEQMVQEITLDENF
jgi:predicted  nucleic acid-binding Zn-ribbon protein